MTITVLNTFEMLYMFVNKLKKMAALYKDDLAIQTSYEHYKEFIKNIHKIQEKKLEEKRRIE